MSSQYWEDLATQISLIDGRREEARARMRAKSVEIAKKRNIRNHKTYVRDSRLWLNVYPWTEHDLRELSVARNTKYTRMLASIVGTIVDLWQNQYPDREDLYLTVPQDETNADAVITVDQDHRDFLPSIGRVGSHDLRCFAIGAMRCMLDGIPVDDLKRELDQIYEAVYPHQE